jgi:hypothetical protein
MSIIDVTQGQSFTTLSAAISGSLGGDVIDVSAGSYSEYFPKINHDLTIEGVGGLAVLTNPGSPTNGQGVLVIDANVTLRNLDISGAVVPDNNGAGVRVETGALTVVNSHLHNNQDGILVNSGAGSVSITGSEIDHNGAGDGYSHNIYVGDVPSLTVTDSYIHDAVGGHEIKSRADVTIITGNRIQDQSGTGNYGVDLPDGGDATITGNTFQKGANTENWIYIHYGGEAPPSYTNSQLTISDNIFINDMPAGNPPYVLRNDTNTAGDLSGQAYPASVTNNTEYGFADPSHYPNGIPVYDLSGPPDTYSANVTLPASSAPVLDTSSPFGVMEPSSAALLVLALLGACVLRTVSRPLSTSG